MSDHLNHTGCVNKHLFYSVIQEMLARMEDEPSYEKSTEKVYEETLLHLVRRVAQDRCYPGGSLSTSSEISTPSTVAIRSSVSVVTTTSG